MYLGTSKTTAFVTKYYDLISQILITEKNKHFEQELREETEENT
jgi:hypothetical protein